MPIHDDTPPSLARVSKRARRAYLARIADPSAGEPWWTAVIVTASSEMQAGRYREEIQRRRRQGVIPAGVQYLVTPDIEDRRIGSGGATLQALQELAKLSLPGISAGSLAEWWRSQRVLMIHSGGDSRRLPQYSLAGKLFSILPVKTLWDEVSTVFDEMLALSTAWVARIPAGLLVSSGDVILTFDAGEVDWNRPGVCGVAMREPAEVGAQHGVYVLDEHGRVYSFLQKPTAAQVQAAGGMLPGQRVAVDSGLLKFDPEVAARLTELAGVTQTEGAWRVGPGVQSRQKHGLPVIDLYQHITLTLTGELHGEAGPAVAKLREALRGVPFWCSLVQGDFTHIGTTQLFRDLMTEQTSFRQLYAAHQQVGTVDLPDVQAGGGVVVDSLLGQGSVLGAGAVAIECCLEAPVRLGRGAILHGLSGISDPVEVPEELVVHQVPVALPEGGHGMVVRVYGVMDDPRRAGDQALWMGRPLLEVLDSLGLAPEDVWPYAPSSEWTLWKARLFPIGSVADAWDAARWMMGLPSGFTAARWRYLPRLSLASSAQYVDSGAIAESRAQRLQANWQRTALSLAASDTDLRPLLAYAPSLTALAKTGRELTEVAAALESAKPTDAASRHFQASRFYAQAGFVDQADEARTRAFSCVQQAVERGIAANLFAREPVRWAREFVQVSAPARIDFGGGWSDTPPFCLDWGGTVLNIAVRLQGQHPIRATIRRLDERVIRCVTDEAEGAAEYLTREEVHAPVGPGQPFSLVRVALQMAGFDDPREHGLEVCTRVNLPVGSGLGTSSILAAALLQALAEARGVTLSQAELTSQVMRLEQLLTTGGGWQDQAGGIYPGAKLIYSGPSVYQELRVQPVAWSRERQQEFAARLVLHYTGIRRIAKNLLAQVVGSYLAREVATVQVLHSIKTLALEMAHAMTAGDWAYLGKLMDRHWQLNQVLDPNTTNAPITRMLEELRPYLAGAKLAGAGGGGFLMLLARDPEAADALRSHLRQPAGVPGELYEYAIDEEGLRCQAARETEACLAS